MIAPNQEYVAADLNGTLRIAQTRISLDSVAILFLQGDSPESIQRQFPVLSLEQVYGAIAYYLRNRQSVDEYLEQQSMQWEKLKATIDATPNPVVERLRSMNASKASPHST